MEWTDNFIKIIDNFGERIGIAVNWSQQNIIPYIENLSQKFITYKITASSTAIIISLLYIIISTICLVIVNKRKPFFATEDNGYSTCLVNGYLYAWMAISLMVISIAIMLPIFLVNLVTLIKCLTFPEMIIYEYIKEMS